MRALLLVTLATLLAAPVLAAAPVARTIACSASAPQPGGICSPYDRTYCRFADGTLLRDDARDPNAPYLLRPVPQQADLYCRYDADLRPAGVETVHSPAEQKRRLDASKLRRHHQ